MSSKLKSDTARTNGAKSHGPVTPEGKAKSSANSLRHGFTGKFVFLHDESDEQFHRLHEDYIDQFQPQSGVERDLVEIMVISRWRLRRLLAIESHLFDTEMMRCEKKIDAQFEGMDVDARMAWVFQKLADEGNALALVVRYEGAINRAYDRAFKQLQVLQAARRSAPAAALGSFGNALDSTPSAPQGHSRIPVNPAIPGGQPTGHPNIQAVSPKVTQVL